MLRVTIMNTGRHQNSDVLAGLVGANVTKVVTTLLYHTPCHQTLPIRCDVKMVSERQGDPLRASSFSGTSATWAIACGNVARAVVVPMARKFLGGRLVGGDKRVRAVLQKTGVMQTPFIEKLEGADWVQDRSLHTSDSLEFQNSPVDRLKTQYPATRPCASSSEYAVTIPSLISDILYENTPWIRDDFSKLMVIAPAESPLSVWQESHISFAAAGAEKRASCRGISQSFFMDHSSSFEGG